MSEAAPSYEELRERLARAEATLEALCAGQVDLLIGAEQPLVVRLREVEEQLRHSQKMEALGRLAGGVAHDFNNLLMVINGMAELALRAAVPGDPVRGRLEEIRRAVGRAADLTRQLLAFGRRQVLAPRAIKLDALVGETERMLARVLGEDVVLETRLGAGSATVLADPGQLELVLVNLAVNARDAMPSGGTLRIATEAVEVARPAPDAAHTLPPPGRYVLVRVTDTGTGMDAATLAQAFEPFFTTKEPGRGTGLGLSTAYGIVKQSGGHLWVHSTPGQGTTFRIYLPALGAASEETGSWAPAEVPRGTETVLLVEDEAVVRAVVSEQLESLGYAVLAAGGSAEAMVLAADPARSVDLALIDVVMPGMDGRGLAERLRALRPGLRVVLMSGHAEDALLHHGMERAELAFLSKPFTRRALALKLREALG